MIAQENHFDNLYVMALREALEERLDPHYTETIEHFNTVATEMLNDGDLREYLHYQTAIAAITQVHGAKNDE